MRLAVVSPLPPGMPGIGEYGLHVVRGLARSGAVEEMLVLADRAPRAPLHDDVAGAAVLRVWSRNDWAGGLRVQAGLERFSPDVVWYNLGLTMFGGCSPGALLGLAGPLLTRALGYPTVVTLHEVIDCADLPALTVPAPALALAAGGLVTRLVLCADRVCVTLASYAGLLRRRYRATNVEHVPHGLFSPPEPRAQSGEGGVLLLAAHGPHKGLPVLLDAWGRLRPEFPCTDLFIAGDDHPRFPGYLGGIRGRHGDGSGIHWCGYLAEHDLSRLLRQVSVVAVPSLATTGSSSVLHRAAAAGKAIVASDLPDLREAASEAGLSVRFVPPGDSPALASALRELLASDSLRQAAGEANLAAARHLTIERTCARYLDIMHALVEPPAHPVAQPVHHGPVET